jgi:hypothetical protein
VFWPSCVDKFTETFECGVVCSLFLDDNTFFFGEVHLININVQCVHLNINCDIIFFVISVAVIVSQE